MCLHIFFNPCLFIEAIHKRVSGGDSAGRARLPADVMNCQNAIDPTDVSLPGDSLRQRSSCLSSCVGMVRQVRRNPSQKRFDAFLTFLIETDRQIPSVAVSTCSGGPPPRSSRNRRLRNQVPRMIARATLFADIDSRPRSDVSRRDAASQ
jgi:hypothetical protein